MADEFERKPAPRYVTTIEELATLDEDLMVKGYLAGFKNAADFTQRNRAYWHGYLNGQVDGKHAKGSPQQAELARAVVASGYLANRGAPDAPRPQPADHAAGAAQGV